MHLRDKGTLLYATNTAFMCIKHKHMLHLWQSTVVNSRRSFPRNAKNYQRKERDVFFTIVSILRSARIRESAIE